MFTLKTWQVQCSGGGFVSKLINHCEKMLENIDEALIIRLLNTIRCMMKTNLQFTPDVSLYLFVGVDCGFFMSNLHAYSLC